MTHNDESGGLNPNELLISLAQPSARRPKVPIKKQEFQSIVYARLKKDCAIMPHLLIVFCRSKDHWKLGYEDYTIFLSQTTYIKLIKKKYFVHISSQASLGQHNYFAVMCQFIRYSSDLWLKQETCCKRFAFYLFCFRFASLTFRLKLKTLVKSNFAQI